jgi:TolB-like protein
MKKIFRLAKATLIAVLVAVLGYTDAQTFAGERAPTGVHDQLPKTLAILPFENNSVTDPEHYEPLANGLAAMLITDLTNHVSTLKLIERDKIQALLKEIALSQTGGIDNSTAIKAGKILGAQATTFGSFMVLGKQVRIDARIVKVETSEVLMADSILGRSDNFIHLEKELAAKIAKSLNATFMPTTETATSDIDAALYFSKGLAAYDHGDVAEAKRMFEKSVELDAAYKEQVESITDMKQ